MTDPTPAEALKACPNPECQSSRIDTWAGERDRLRSAVQGYCECCDCGVRGPMTCGYSGAPVERCTEKAKSEAARMWNAFADALSPPDAGEVRTYREDEWQGIKTAPKDGTEIDLFGGVSWKGGAPNRVPNCAWKHLENGPDWHTRGDKGWEPLGAIGWEPTHWRALPAPPAFERTLNRSARGGDSEARHLDANIEKWPWLEHDDDWPRRRHQEAAVIGEGGCDHVWIKVTRTTYDLPVPYYRCSRCGNASPNIPTPTPADLGKE